MHLDILDGNMMWESFYSLDQFISPMFFLKLFGFPNILNNKLKSLKLIDS